MPDEPRTTNRWWGPLVKLAVVVAVCLAVGDTLRRGWAELAERSWPWDVPWLVAAGAIYAVGLAPMAWFWQRVLAAFGQRPDAFSTLEAYYLGHLGKYVPGKALVVVIRVGVLRRWITSLRLAVASVLIETLTMMAVGGVLAASLTLAATDLDRRWALLAALMAVAAAVPTLPPVARRLAGKAPGGKPATDTEDTDAQQEQPADAEVMRRGLSLPLLATGWLAAAATWGMLGLSLWATLRGIGVELDPAGDLPLLVATVSLAVVAGFMSMIPGGFVVRDVLVVELLASSCGEASALVAAALLRVIWLLSELIVCGILRIVRKRFRSTTNN